MITTPRQLDQRSELYHQLGSLTSAGIGLLQGIDHLRRNPPSRALRGPLDLLSHHINQGTTFAEALRLTGAWVPEFDLALLDAGERSGRLDSSFRLLADYYRERAQMIRSVISDMIYPVIMVHFVVLIFPVSAIIDLAQNLSVLGFVARKLMILVPVYALVGVLIYLCQGQRSVFWRSLIEQAGRVIPVLGTARHNLALARLTAALAALVNAGVSIIESWPLAAAASGSPALCRTVAGWKDPLQRGETPADLVSASREFPEVFAGLYRTAEESGKMDESLERLHGYYQDHASRGLKAVSKWGPWLFYLGVMLYAAYYIIQFWAGYFGQINQLL